MAHPVDVYVGQKLRQRRWMMGMTQRKLGDSIGTRFQQIQKYENGTNRISASRMWDLATTLDVPVSFFFEGLDGQAPAADGAGETTLEDTDAINLIRVYGAIPLAQRRTLLELARALGNTV